MPSMFEALRRELASLSRLPEPAPVVATDENFDEHAYLEANSDVAQAVLNGTMASGWHHYSVFGKNEDRKLFAYPSELTQSLPIFRTWYRLRKGVGRLVRDQRQLEARLYSLEVDQRQLRDMLELVHHCSPPPPKHLQLRVVGNYGTGFVESGFTGVVPMLNRALRTTGLTVSDFATILDFGCGCGRAVFAMSQLAPGADLHATDIDAEAIAWLSSHVPQLATYAVCPNNPPTAYGDGTFDFIFGISVLTHLPEDMQFAWLAELARISKPNGYVVLTTHGDTHVQNLLDFEREAFEQTGFLHVPSGYGESISLPGFYQNSFHSHEYIRREWSKYFEIVDIQPPEGNEHQDLVVLRSRS